MELDFSKLNPQELRDIFGNTFGGGTGNSGAGNNTSAGNDVSSGNSFLDAITNVFTPFPGVPGGSVYTPPAVDSTFSSGLNYAKSIAGGQNIPNMIAPGVSYSSDMPGGYTAFGEVKAPVQTPTPPPSFVTPPPVQPPINFPPINFPPINIGGPVEPPVNIGGPVTDPVIPPIDFPPINFPPIDFPPININIGGPAGGPIPDPVLPPMPPINVGGPVGGPVPDPVIPPIDPPVSGPIQVPPPNFVYEQPEIDYDKLYDKVISNMDFPDFSNFATIDDLNKGIDGIDIPTIDTSQFVTKDDIPTFNPYDFKDDFLSIAQDGIDIPTYEAPDLSNFVTVDDLNRSIGDIPTQSTYDDRALKDRLDMLENQYTTGFDELNNMFTPIDTSQFLTAEDIPTYNAPDLSGYATLNDLNSFKDSISNTPINIGGPVDLPGMSGPSMDPIPPMSVGGVGGGSVLDSTNYVVPQVPLNNLSNQNPPQGPVGMTPQETAKVSSQQELLNLMSNKDVLSQIPADDGVRNQYQVELDEYINKSPINMDTYKEELPVGSAINLGIPAVMETVVPMAVPGLSLATNISNSLSSNNNPSPAPAPRPSSPSVSRPNYSHSQVSKFGR